MKKVDNAIIMAAGTSSRFAPLSFEKPKSLFDVRGEILIERQIRQLKEAGINEIIVVTGYKSDFFNYLSSKYNVVLIHNDEFLTRNNNGSIYAARAYIKNSYICSSDNYFIDNPFSSVEEFSFYSALFSQTQTKEWCMEEDEKGYISSIKIGGKNSWFMLGHAFWDENFSKEFISILEQDYNKPETRDKLWEQIFLENLDKLKMRIKKYDYENIFEFDTLDELRSFDKSYLNNTRSIILKGIAIKLNCKEKDITNITAFKGENNSADGFLFNLLNKKYIYSYSTQKLEEIK